MSLRKGLEVRPGSAAVVRHSDRHRVGVFEVARSRVVEGEEGLGEVEPRSGEVRFAFDRRRAGHVVAEPKLARDDLNRTARGAAAPGVGLDPVGRPVVGPVVVVVGSGPELVEHGVAVAVEERQPGVVARRPVGPRARREARRAGCHRPGSKSE